MLAAWAVLAAHPAIDATRIGAQGHSRGGSAVLVLYGTGLRGAREWSATIGGRVAAVTYAGPQGEFAGLDQINVVVPEGVTGVVDVVVRANGETANAVKVEIK